MDRGGGGGLIFLAYDDQEDQRINTMVRFCANIKFKFNKIWKIAKWQSFFDNFCQILRFFRIYSILAEY